MGFNGASLVSRQASTLLVALALLSSACSVKLSNLVTRKPSSSGSDLTLTSSSLSFDPVLLSGETSRLHEFIVTGGSADEGSLVLIYIGDPTCSGSPAGAGAVSGGQFSAALDTNAGAWAGDGLKTFFIQYVANSSKGACQDTGFSYTLDTKPPKSEVVGISPGATGSDTRPVLDVSADEGAQVRIYTDAACAGASIASGVGDASGGFSVQTSALSVGTYSFYTRGQDAAGNVSPCYSSKIDYELTVEKVTKPSIDQILPPSPAVTNRPTLKGTAEPGTTVKI